MKISKSVIISYMFLLLIVCLQILFLIPLVQDLYLDVDVRNFKENSWKYTLVFFIAVVLVVGFYALKRNVLNKGFALNAAMLLFLLYFVGKSPINNLLLYLNSKVNVSYITKTYTVSRYDANKNLLIYDKKDEIISDSGLDKIDSIRLSKNQKSLFELNNKDTLNVGYKIGFLKVKFLDLDN